MNVQCTTILEAQTNHPMFAIKLCSSHVKIADVPDSIKLLLLGSVHIVLQAICVVIASDVGCSPVWIDPFTSQTPCYSAYNFLSDFGVHSHKSFSVIFFVQIEKTLTPLPPSSLLNIITDRTWLPRYALCSTSHMAHQLFKLYPLRAHDYCLNVWPSPLLWMFWIYWSAQ